MLITVHGRAGACKIKKNKQKHSGTQDNLYLTPVMANECLHENMIMIHNHTCDQAILLDSVTCYYVSWAHTK